MGSGDAGHGDSNVEADQGGVAEGDAQAGERLGWEDDPADSADLAERDRQVDSVLRAARVWVAVVARSVAEVGDSVTLSQLRVLVVIATRGPVNLGAVARELRVHPSNATRICDRLVAARLLRRDEDPNDRRHLALTLTPKGRRLVDQMMRHRRAAVAEVVARMPEVQRRRLAGALDAFASAAGEVTDVETSMLGWQES
ncbi:MarR family winged helix-turn-helix transcriptional regulator [Actinopolymorpha singaporensis]|uniref:DNA-binding transcriptional regulator, MarR family n=1 Tax=Actinopolymorpha singaporensis TaxID=117157 RepID=A0A1H1WK54_9ACTN|nr:MarR family transcriptional regulator [Actinopolymorpha singaporensis]SDS97372.1 DNA-binding transcriptional regulator, MarR family [Actinopolymorpha singaporensis]